MLGAQHQPSSTCGVWGFFPFFQAELSQHLNHITYLNSCVPKESQGGAGGELRAVMWHSTADDFIHINRPNWTSQPNENRTIHLTIPSPPETKGKGVGHPGTWQALLCLGPAPCCHLCQDVPQVMLEHGGAELLHVAAQHLGSAAGALEPQELLPANWGGARGAQHHQNAPTAPLVHPQNQNGPRQLGEQANHTVSVFQRSKAADVPLGADGIRNQSLEIRDHLSGSQRCLLSPQAGAEVPPHGQTSLTCSDNDSSLMTKINRGVTCRINPFTNPGQKGAVEAAGQHSSGTRGMSTNGSSQSHPETSGWHFWLMEEELSGLTAKVDP